MPNLDKVDHVNKADKAGKMAKTTREAKPTPEHPKVLLSPTALANANDDMPNVTHKAMLAPTASAPHTQVDASLIHYNHITYLLYVLSFFTAGLLWIVPIVMNYLRRQEAQGTWLATHFDWQIKTFWYSLLLAAMGIILLFFGLGGTGVGVVVGSDSWLATSIVLIGLGGLLLTIAVLWHLYRIIRGWIALTNKRPIP